MAMADKDYKESARLLLEEIERMSEMVDKEEMDYIDFNCKVEKMTDDFFDYIGSDVADLVYWNRRAKECMDAL